MSAEVRALVDAPLAEYGIAAVPADGRRFVRLPARCGNCYDVDVVEGQGLASRSDARGKIV